MKTSLFALVRMSIFFALTTAAQSPNAAPLAAHIVNGERVDSGKYDFAVSLQVDGLHECGGSLIANNKVLTAAHCVVNNGVIDDPASWTAVMGAIDNTSTSAITSKVLSISVPRQYRETGASGVNMPYDVAILTLAQPAPTDFPIVTIANRWDDKAGTSVTAIGWGEVYPQNPDPSVDNKSHYPRYLRKVDLNILTNKVCTDLNYKGLINTSLQICATNDQHGDACQGDSGGPLFKYEHNQFIQLGTVSWGEGCGFDKFPGVYTRLSNPVIKSFIARNR